MAASGEIGVLPSHVLIDADGIVASAVMVSGAYTVPQLSTSLCHKLCRYSDNRHVDEVDRDANCSSGHYVDFANGTELKREYLSRRKTPLKLSSLLVLRKPELSQAC